MRNIIILVYYLFLSKCLKFALATHIYLPTVYYVHVLVQMRDVVQLAYELYGNRTRGV